MFDKIQLSQQALNGRAVPLRPMASTAQHLPRSALYSVRAQHRRPSLSSSQCRPLEPQATHAKFPTATSSTSSGSTSRQRPICLPPICGGSTLLHSSARSPLSRLQWPPPRLVNTTCCLPQSTMASPPSGLAQDESFSSKGSCNLSSMAAAALVRRSRSLQQGYTLSPIAVHMRSPTPPRQSRALSTPRSGAKVNALRLCLTNNVWTACRLLSVKGTLATVVCEGQTRQLNFDTLAKYNALKICTTGSVPVSQHLTLPILRSLDANTPGLQSGRVQDEAGTPRLSSMPASQTTILAFIGYLASLGKIRSSSLHPYLSAINSLHADFGFTKPAQGHWISLARKGFGEIEGSLNQAPTKAAPFPASYMLSILRHGLQDSSSSHHVRVCACLTAQFAFFSRADSGINLLAEDVDIFSDTFAINVKAKNIERSQAAPLSRVTSATHDPQRLFQQLQTKWQRLRGHTLTTSPYWLFQDEPPATAQIITTWLRDIMTALELHTPPGVSYTGHSLRRGGASAAHAINVSTPRIIAWGLWRDFNTAISYIDVNVQQDQAAFIFFSNLLAQG